MRPHLLAASLLAPALAALPATAHAQRSVELTAFAGGAAFGDFHQHSVRIRAPDQQVGVMRQRSITARRGSSVGGALTYWLTPVWGVRGHMSWSSTRFGERYDPEAERRLREDPAFVGRADFAPLRVRYRDLTAVFRVPARVGELSAYALAGLGQIRYDARPRNGQELPSGAGDAFLEDAGRAWSGAGVAGIAAHYALGRFRLVAEVVNHISRSPIRAVEPGEVFRSDDLVVERPPPRDEALPVPEGGERMNNVRFVIGLSGAIGSR